MELDTGAGRCHPCIGEQELGNDGSKDEEDKYYSWKPIEPIRYG